MKHSVAKLFKSLCGVVVMLAIVAGIANTPVLAATNGIYIATATPHYKHPQSGEVEDAGGENSAVLGQSMTESATYDKALVEVDTQGNTYVTVRLQLMDNIENPQFQVDGEDVEATLMQEDYINYTADYRMQVNSEDAIIRCNMYVIAMGREVVFYITVSDLLPGCEDFITSIEVLAGEQGGVETTTATETVTTQEVTTSQEITTTIQEETTEEITTVQETTTIQETTSEQETTVQQEETTTKADNSDKDKEVQGIQQFDKAGNLMEDETTANTENKNEEGKKSIVGWIVGGILVVVAAGFGIWYFCFFKKKK